MGAGTPLAQVESPLTGVWCFGRAEVDAARGTLRFDGNLVPLDRSSFQVLLRLLRQPGEVIAKEELLRCGWPGRRVSDNSLPKAIGRLRHALQDPDGTLLRVEHGYGYRLALPAAPDLPPRVAAAVPAAAPGGGSDPATLPPAAAAAVEASSHGPHPPRRARLVRRAGLGLLLLAGVALLGTWWTQPPAAPPAASIAVLPFIDLSAGQDQGHFAQGLADQLLDSLARLPRLRVASRTSSFAYRERPVDIATIGRELKVATVLEGSVRKSNDRLRVTLQLIDSADGYHRWSQTYDRPIGELFAMQDEITRAVVGALKLELLPRELAETARRGTDVPEAWEQLLLAQAVFNDDETANRRSMRAYRRATELDPRYVDAWLGLADVLGHSGLYADTAEEALEGKREAQAAIDRALQLDPSRGEVWLLRGDLRYAHWWEWQGAEDDLERGRALLGADNPSYLLRLARLRAATGRHEEALALTARILELDPLSGAAATRGYHLLAARRYDEAEALLQQQVRVEPVDEHAHYYLGLIDLLRGDPRDALAHFENSAHVFRLTGAALAWHALGDRSASDRQLALLIERYGHLLPYQAAEVHAWRGEPDAAFAWLERSVELHDASLMYLRFDPLLDPLRQEPRFAALLARVGLAP